MNHKNKNIEHPGRKKLMKEEFQTIRALRNNHDITIKTIDKGSTMVIKDKTQYTSEGHKQLSNTLFYNPTDTDLTGGVIQRVNLHTHYKGIIYHKNM